MIVTIVGLPGRLTDFCRDVCQAVLVAGGRDPLLEEVNSLNALARVALQAGERSAVVVARQPERTLLEALREAARPFLLVLDDPRRAVLHVAQGGLPPRDAILHVGASCATVSDVLAIANAVRITHETIGSDPAGFARQVVSVTGLPEGPELLDAAQAAVALHLPAILSDPSEPDIATKLETDLGPVWGLAAKAAVGGYWTAFFEGKVGKLIAARELFIAVEGSQSVTGLLDVTGRPRLLAYGPYVRLPRGQWTLRMMLAFSPELVGTPFTLDVARFDGRVVVELGRIAFTAISGRYVAQTTFAHDEPGLGLEFRLFVEKATFDGQVAIGFAELERLDDQEPPDLGSVADLRIPG